MAGLGGGVGGATRVGRFGPLRCRARGAHDGDPSPHLGIPEAIKLHRGRAARFDADLDQAAVGRGQCYDGARRLLAPLIALMFLATLWFVYLQAFVIKAFCVYCLLSAAITTALTLVVFARRLPRRNRLR